MPSILTYSIISVLIVSLVSFVGLFALSINADKLRKILIYLISFSAGALFGDAFIHLLPEAIKEFGFGTNVSLYILSGIVIFFVIEKVIQWRHCHTPISENHVHPFAYMNLIGDAFHNFLDGLIIGASYLLSIPAGIATTLAIIFHEIPQEIGDFGVLIHGGFSRGKALLFNFFSALTAFLGAVISLLLSNFSTDVEAFLIPLAVGGFIYIAGSDLIPELHKNMHKETVVKKSLLQLIAFILGILVMLALLALG